MAIGFASARSAIAMQLDCPTENDEGKAMTVDALKEEILVNSGEDTLLIFPEAKRLTTSIRYWLEDMIAAGVRIVCFSVANPGKDIFLDMLEIELSLPSDRHIREVMEAEAQKQGLQISKSRLAELQPLAGRKLIDRVKEADSQKLTVSDILILLGGDKKNPRKNSSTLSTSVDEKLNDSCVEQVLETSVENPRKIIPTSKKRRQKGYGSGWIQLLPITRNGKQYKQYWYNYEEWRESDCAPRTGGAPIALLKSLVIFPSG